eukprot:5653729-Amphidinium_carterae.1
MKSCPSTAAPVVLQQLVAASDEHHAKAFIDYSNSGKNKVQAHDTLDPVMHLPSDVQGRMVI